MALSSSSANLPLNQWLDIVGGPAAKKLDLAYFGEDEWEVPLPPIVRFTVSYSGKRYEIPALLSGLAITGAPDNKREYALNGGWLKFFLEHRDWCRIGGIEVASYSPKGGGNKGTLRLREFSWQPPSFLGTGKPNLAHLRQLVDECLGSDYTTDYVRSRLFGILALLDGVN